MNAAGNRRHMLLHGTNLTAYNKWLVLPNWLDYRRLETLSSQLDVLALEYEYGTWRT